MGTTPLTGLPYPDGGDPVDGPGAFEAALEAVETKLVMPFATTTARDNAVTSPTDGMTAYIASGDVAEGLYCRNTDDAWRYPWNLPWGSIGYAEVTANQTGITTIVDLTSLTLTWTAVANRVYKITGFAQFTSSVAADVARLSITTDGNTLVQMGQQVVGATPVTIAAVRRIVTGAGSQTYKLRAERSAGTGNVAMNVGATLPGFILVEDIGPSGAPD